MREIECTSGDEGSEACTVGLGPEAWAISHARVTGHTGFREIRTAYLRVVQAEGGPVGEGASGPERGAAPGGTVCRPSGPAFGSPPPEAGADDLPAEA
ncbi:hypothetical protein ACIBCM_25005 [Streptomyces sp. NPDC051018]|uniref:DUF7848 domain-containing protein n=1 Tax=Streptomyces sp. NPDC051018 TaxID=3365639 RepID=UPI0037B9C9B6